MKTLSNDAVQYLINLMQIDDGENAPSTEVVEEVYNLLSALSAGLNRT